MHHHAKFHAGWSNRSGDMAIFYYSRWRPSAILEFLKFKIFIAGIVWMPNMRPPS